MLVVAVGSTVAEVSRGAFFKIAPWLGHVLSAVAVGSTVAVGSRGAFFKLAPLLGHVLLAVAVGSTVTLGSRGVALKTAPWLGHVLLAVAVGSAGGYFPKRPPGWGMCCWLSLWAERSLWARGETSPLVGACVVGCRCGLHGRCGLEGRIFQNSPLVGACVVGCRCGLSGRCGLAGETADSLSRASQPASQSWRALGRKTAFRDVRVVPAPFARSEVPFWAK